MARGPGLMPEGESLRRALRWLDERVKEEPKLERGRLVNDAAQRFDLSPVEQEFLLTSWARQR